MADLLSITDTASAYCKCEKFLIALHLSISLLKETPAASIHITDSSTVSSVKGKRKHMVHVPTHAYTNANTKICTQLPQRCHSVAVG